MDVVTAPFAAAFVVFVLTMVILMPFYLWHLCFGEGTSVELPSFIDDHIGKTMLVLWIILTGLLIALPSS